ncbi:MAG TPA: universal stress protein [Candidatus Sulfotelmatobacter sp.]|nr:universal stress protein [Candidatus Sulfotelmatobacter sp.]
MAIRRILYPTDFSECAQEAGRYAAAFAHALGASLHVLHVPLIGLPTEASAFATLDLARCQRVGRARAKARLESLLHEPGFEGLRVQATVEGTIPEDQILMAAETSDLLVMGTHGRAGLSRLMLGSVAEKVASTAACPVVLVKHPGLQVVPPSDGASDRDRTPRAPRLLNILVPLDGSLLAEEILSQVKDLAAAFEAVIILLLVVAPTLRLHAEPGEARRLPDPAEGERYLQGKVDALRREGCMAEAIIRCGDAAVEILDCATERDVDLIGLAVHGEGGLRRWLSGSVANKVLHRSHTPVLLYRAWSRRGRRAEEQTATAQAEDGGLNLPLWR